MKNSRISVFVISLIFLTTTLMAQEVYGEEDLPISTPWGGTGSEKAIPFWVDQNFKWYGEGLIEQSELVNAIKFLIENEILVIDRLPEQSMGINYDEYSSGFAYKDDETGKHIYKYYETDQKTTQGGSLIDKPTFGEKFILLPAVPPSDTNKDKTYWLVKLEERNTIGDKENTELALWYEEAYSYYQSVQSGRDSQPDQATWSEFINQMNWAKQQLNWSEYGTITMEFKTEVTSFDVGEGIQKLVANGETSVKSWEETIDQIAEMNGIDTSASVAEDLQKIVVLCSTVIDKEVFALQAELSLLQELSDMHTADTRVRTAETTSNTSSESDLYEFHQWVTKKTTGFENKIQSLKTGIKVLEETLPGLGDDAQLANTDLQNILHTLTRTLQLMSNVSKIHHDASVEFLRNVD